VNEWIDVWMPTDDEIREAMSATGWDLVETGADGRHRIRLFESRARQQACEAGAAGLVVELFSTAGRS